MLHHKPLLCSDIPCRFIRRVKTCKHKAHYSAGNVRRPRQVTSMAKSGWGDGSMHVPGWSMCWIGGSLWGGLWPGSHCFDSNVQTAENSVSLTCHTLPSCSTSSASIFIWCPTEAFSLTIYFWVTIKFCLFLNKKKKDYIYKKGLFIF